MDCPEASGHLKDRRLRSVAACVEGYGERIQYSVFICDLPDEEAAMRGDLEVRVRLSEDSVMKIDLGRAGDSGRFQFLRHHEKLPVSSAVIV